MADMQLKLDVDSSGAVKGTKDFSNALHDVADDLEKIGDAGDEAARDIAQDFDKIARESKSAGEKTGRNLKEGFDEAKDEAKSSGREAAASFDGSFESVTDFVQETIANALGGFGPAGAAAGIAIAATLGAALQGLADKQEALEEVRDAAADLAGTLYDNKGVVPLSDQVTKLFSTLSKERTAQNVFQGLVNNWADLGTVLDDLKRSSDQANVPLKTLIKGLSGGDITVAKKALGDVQAQIDEINHAIETHSSWDLLASGMDTDTTALESTKTELKAVIDQAALADELLGAVGDGYTADEITEEIGSIGQAWQDALTDAQDYFTHNDDGELTGFDFGAYVTGLQTKAAEANTYKSLILGVPPEIQAEAVSINNAAGVESANAFLQGFQSADADTQAGIISSIQGATAAASGVAVVEVGVNANTEQAQADITAAASADYTASVKVTADAAEADNETKQFRNRVTADKTTKAKIDADTAPARVGFETFRRDITGQRSTVPIVGDLSGINGQISNFRPKTVYVPAVIYDKKTGQPIP